MKLEKFFESIEDELGDVGDFQQPGFRAMESEEDAPLGDVENIACRIIFSQNPHWTEENKEWFLEHIGNEFWCGADTLDAYRDAEETSESMEKAIKKAAEVIAPQVWRHWRQDEFPEED